ncbi:Cell surface proteoglycan that bears heparan sulfate [Mactra antiquata]
MKMRRLGIFVCVFLTSFGILYSHNIGSSCHRVKEEFTKLSGEDLVPDVPFIDEGLQICSRSLSKEQASCCSQDTEMKYLLLSEQYIVQSVRYQNALLKALITEHMGDYQGKVLSLVQQSFNSTSSKLTSWYSIPPEEHKLSLTNFFTDIEDLIKLKHVIVKNSVSTLFDNLFPVIFKNVIYQNPGDTWTHHYHHCLARHREDIRPQVFGKVPEEIARKLNNGLALARAYLEALQIVTETINTTDNLLIEDECKHAVTRLQYCKHCRGFVDVKPCKGFCLDVMRGCLSKIAEIGPEWNNIITSVEGLVREMSEKSLDEVFKELVSGVSEAIMHAMVTAPEFYQQIHDLCDIPMTTSGSQIEPKSLQPGKLAVAFPEVSGPLSMDIMKVTLDLVDSKGLYSNLADNICSDSNTFEQDPLSGSCWNGTEVSVFLRDAVDIDILNQARNNPEVKVSLVLDKDLRALKDKMSVVNLGLQAHTKKSDRARPRNYMISDDPTQMIFDASGNKPIGNINIGAGVTLGDDEDYAYSGSGSGDYDSPETDVKIDTGDVNAGIDVVFKGNPSNRQQYDVDHGGNLGANPPRTQAPRHNDQQVNDNDNSAAVSINMSITVLLSTLLMYILAQRR